MSYDIELLLDSGSVVRGADYSDLVVVHKGTVAHGGNVRVTGSFPNQPVKPLIAVSGGINVAYSLWAEYTFNHPHGISTNRFDIMSGAAGTLDFAVLLPSHYVPMVQDYGIEVRDPQGELVLSSGYDYPNIVGAYNILRGAGGETTLNLPALAHGKYYVSMNSFRPTFCYPNYDSNYSSSFAFKFTGATSIMVADVMYNGGSGESIYLDNALRNFGCYPIPNAIGDISRVWCYEDVLVFHI